MWGSSHSQRQQILFNQLSLPKVLIQIILLYAYERFLVLEDNEDFVFIDTVTSEVIRKCLSFREIQELQKLPLKVKKVPSSVYYFNHAVSFLNGEIKRDSSADGFKKTWTKAVVWNHYLFGVSKKNGYLVNLKTNSLFLVPDPNGYFDKNALALSENYLYILYLQSNDTHYLESFSLEDHTWDTLHWQAEYYAYVDLIFVSPNRSYLVGYFLDPLPQGSADIY